MGKLTFYLVGEDKGDGYYDIYGKGARSLEKAYIREVGRAQLNRVAQQHNCTSEQALKYYISQSRMWSGKQGAEVFAARFSNNEHKLFVIQVPW